MLKNLKNNITDYGPGENFLDHNTYCYRMVNGKMKLKGIQLGQGWDRRYFNYKELSCYKSQKGEDSVTKVKLNWEELDPKILELYKQGYSLRKIGEELGIAQSTVHTRIKELKKLEKKQKQAEAKELEEAAKPEPVTEEPSEPAVESVPEEQQEVNAEVYWGDPDPLDYPDYYSSADQELLNRIEYSFTYAKAISDRATDLIRQVIEDPIAYTILKEMIRQDVI